MKGGPGIYPQSHHQNLPHYHLRLPFHSKAIVTQLKCGGHKGTHVKFKGRAEVVNIETDITAQPRRLSNTDSITAQPTYKHTRNSSPKEHG